MWHLPWCTSLETTQRLHHCGHAPLNISSWLQHTRLQHKSVSGRVPNANFPGCLMAVTRLSCSRPLWRSHRSPNPRLPPPSLSSTTLSPAEPRTHDHGEFYQDFKKRPTRRRAGWRRPCVRICLPPDVVPVFRPAPRWDQHVSRLMVNVSPEA